MIIIKSTTTTNFKTSRHRNKCNHDNDYDNNKNIKTCKHTVTTHPMGTIELFKDLGLDMLTVPMRT